MQKIWLPALIVVLALLLTSQAMAVPKLLIEDDTFDFGFVPQDSKVSHVFWLKSVGDDSLKILKVRPG
ncbi:MAG: hypothetical protein R3F48_10215 [Candidatus Zixiibacteriota bacterium]